MSAPALGRTWWRRSARFLTPIAGGVLSSLAAGVVMLLMRITLEVRTVPERVLEAALIFTPPEVFEAGFQRYGFDAKRYALMLTILGMLLLLAGLGAWAIGRRWSIRAIIFLGLALWLFVMLVVMPLSEAGPFALDLIRGPRPPSACTWRRAFPSPPRSPMRAPSCMARAQPRRTAPNTCIRAAMAALSSRQLLRPRHPPGDQHWYSPPGPFPCSSGHSYLPGGERTRLAELSWSNPSRSDLEEVPRTRRPRLGRPLAGRRTWRPGQRQWPRQPSRRRRSPRFRPQYQRQ